MSRLRQHHDSVLIWNKNFLKQRESVAVPMVQACIAQIVIIQVTRPARRRLVSRRIFFWQAEEGAQPDQKLVNTG